MDKENRREVTISEHKKLNNLIKGNNFSKKNYIGYFLIIIGVLFVVFGTTYKISSDGVVRYDFLVNLLEYGTIDKMKYSFYGPFFASPLYFVNHNFVKYYNVLLFIISSFISFKILYKHIGKEFAINFILLLFAGSMFTYHIRDFFGEIFSTCLFFLGLLYLIFEKKNIIASILLALAVANTPAMVVPLFIFLLYWIVVTRNLKYLIEPSE